MLFRERIAQVEGVAEDDLAWPQSHLAVKVLAGAKKQGMELSVLAAGIDTRRKVGAGAAYRIACFRCLRAGGCLTRDTGCPTKSWGLCRWPLRPSRKPEGLGARLALFMGSGAPPYQAQDKERGQIRWPLSTTIEAWGEL